jgi:hypothetical protein
MVGSTTLRPPCARITLSSFRAGNYWRQRTASAAASIHYVPAERNVEAARPLAPMVLYFFSGDGSNALGNQLGDVPPSRCHSYWRSINVKIDGLRRHRMCYSR